MTTRDRKIYEAFADYGYVGHARAALAMVWAIRLTVLGALFSTLSRHGL